MRPLADTKSLLVRLSNKDHGVDSELTSTVYNELRRLAARYMKRERSDHTLQTTALVHEAYLRLVEQKQTNWQNRAHFFGVAAQLMRRILVDHARGRGRAKRGGEQQKIPLDGTIAASFSNVRQLLVIDEALSNLERKDARQARIVELKFFAGLSTKEAAEVLGTSPRTVEREWALARAWLYMQLDERHGRSD